MNSRICLFVLVTLAGIGGYFIHLQYYLKSISNPYPLIIIFFISLLLALGNEVRSGVSKLTLAGLGATMLYFNMGTEIAIFAREIVLNLIAEHIVNAPYEIQTQIGEEYIMAAKNKIVSVGACMGAGLIISKVVFYNLFRRLFFVLLNLPNSKLSLCPTCERELE